MLDYLEARRHLPGARAADLEWDIDFARRWIVSERPTFDVAMGAVCGSFSEKSRKSLAAVPAPIEAPEMAAQKFTGPF